MGGVHSTISTWTSPSTFGSKIGSVVGLKSKNASPTDIWVLNFKGEELFEGNVLESVVMKFWLYPPTREDMYSLIGGLNYEIQVYKQIKRLIDKNICGSFVKYITSGYCTGNTLQSFPGVVKSNFNRNATFMDEGYEERPSVNTNFKDVLTLSKNSKNKTEYQDYSYRNFGVLCTEALHGGSFDTYIEKNGYNDNSYSIIFQVLCACFAMANNGITHNDLHTGNILLTEISPTTIYYKFSNGLTLGLSVGIKAKIFDFDRSFSKSLGNNPILEDTLCISHSQKNRTLPNLDMVKFIAYLVNECAGTQEKKREMISLISQDRKVKVNILKLFEEDQGCFLRHIKSGKKVAIPDEEYLKFSTPIQSVEQCAKILTKKGLLETLSVEDIPEGSEVYSIDGRIF